MQHYERCCNRDELSYVEVGVSCLSAAYSPPTSRESENCLIGIYHSKFWDNYKNRIVSQLKGTGKIRLVVATTALSMGVNFPDIRYIINWSPARNLLDHHQEAGRAGRDGKQSDIVVIYHGQQLTQCEDEVKSFVRSTSCLRVASYSAFDPNIKPVEPGHDCCSNCLTMCRCNVDECIADPCPFVNPPTEIPKQQQITRPVNEDDKAVLNSALVELSESQSTGMPWSLTFDKTLSHGFSVELIQDLVERCSKIFTVKDILCSFPVFAVAHAMRILEVFQEIFDDIPNYDDLQLPILDTDNYRTVNELLWLL